MVHYTTIKQTPMVHYTNTKQAPMVHYILTHTPMVHYIKTETSMVHCTDTQIYSHIILCKHSHRLPWYITQTLIQTHLVHYTNTHTDTYGIIIQTLRETHIIH